VVRWSHRLTIDLRPENGVSDWFVDQAEGSLEGVLSVESHQRKTTALRGKSLDGGILTQVAKGPARWLCLALGGSALVMTVVGLIVPGIPTVPFLLLSIYGLSRLPGIPGDAAADFPSRQSPRLSLPAP
jgi:hypothetical protein